ncbi:hypothetical protein MAR_023635 [Mya arenaria]|uniref:Uncharacterized protein n=1 Tax=Mya arenaria TaxID=6604 RepID=A0ABY7DNJ5_MYAAR|nr:hypothetical protein MAR_023635 [Mya arenaria]
MENGGRVGGVGTGALRGRLAPSSSALARASRAGIAFMTKMLLNRTSLDRRHRLWTPEDIPMLEAWRALESIAQLYKESSPVDIFDSAWQADLALKPGQCEDHKLPCDQFCDSCIETLSELKKKLLVINDKMGVLEEVISGIQANEEQMCKQLGDSVATMVAKLKSHQTQLENEVRRSSEDLQRPVHAELTKCRGLKTHTSQLMKKLSDIRRDRHRKDVAFTLQLMRTTCQELNTFSYQDIDWYLRNEAIPEVNVPMWDIDLRGLTAAIDQLTWKDRYSGTYDRSISSPSIAECDTGRDNELATGVDWRIDPAEELVQAKKSVTKHNSDGQLRSSKATSSEMEDVTGPARLGLGDRLRRVGLTDRDRERERGPGLTERERTGLRLRRDCNNRGLKLCMGLLGVQQTRETHRDHAGSIIEVYVAVDVILNSLLKSFGPGVCDGKLPNLPFKVVDQVRPGAEPNQLILSISKPIGRDIKKVSF